MASTFSPTLRLELIGDGDQSGIWGQTTNSNLGTLLEQAITGVQTIAMTDANYTLTSFNGVADEARNALLVFTGTLSQQRNVIAPLVEKIYILKNSTTGGFSIQIIGASGTGVVIPNGVTAMVYCDGTNFFAASTGTSGNFAVNGNLSVTGTTALTGALSGSTAAFSGAISAVSPTFTGTPTAPTAAPGTTTTQIATTAFVQNVAGALGTMSSQNANNVNITGGSITGVSISGITDLAVADGGTGASSFAANNVLLGNGSSSFQTVAPGASGNVLTSNGSTWQSTASPAFGVGQSWQNVTGSRATDTTYTNNSGKPIFVIAQVGAQTNGIYVYINGTLLVRHWYDVNGGAGQVGYSTAEFIVGNGDTYYVSNGPLRQWWEFR